MEWCMAVYRLDSYSKRMREFEQRIWCSVAQGMQASRQASSSSSQADKRSDSQLGNLVRMIKRNGKRIIIVAISEFARSETQMSWLCTEMNWTDCYWINSKCTGKCFKIINSLKSECECECEWPFPFMLSCRI